MPSQYESGICFVDFCPQAIRVFLIRSRLPTSKRCKVKEAGGRAEFIGKQEILTDKASPIFSLNLRTNAFLGVIEQLASGLVGLAVYTLVIRRLGIEELGIWSLILTAASFAQHLPSLSGPPLYHHLASAEADMMRERSVKIVETAISSTMIISGAFCILGYYPFLKFIQFTTQNHNQQNIEITILILFVSIFFNNLSNVYLSSLGAIHKMYIKSILNSISYAIMASVSFYFLNQYGIASIAIGLSVQQIFLTFASCFFLKHNIPEISVLFPKLNVSEARIMTKIGTTNFIDGLTPLFMEPITRVLLGSFGFLASVSAFSVAWRFTLLSRSFINSAVLALAPAFGSTQNDTTGRRERLQQQALIFVSGAVPIFMAATIGASPIFSEIIFGNYNIEFITYIILISFGFFWESLAIVFYLRSVGEGRMMWSVTGTLTTALINLVFGGLALKYFGAIGCVAWLALSLSIGSMIKLFGNQRLFGISSRWLFSAPNAALYLSSAAAAATCLYTYWLLRPTMGLFGTAAIMFVSANIIIIIPLTRHPAFELLKTHLYRRGS